MASLTVSDIEQSSFEASHYAFHITECSIPAKKKFKIIEDLALIVDGQRRATLRQAGEVEGRLRWRLNPSVIISSDSLITAQVKLKRSRVKAVWTEEFEIKVEIYAESILQRWSDQKPGDRPYEYVEEIGAVALDISVRPQTTPESARELEPPAEDMTPFGDLANLFDDFIISDCFRECQKTIESIVESTVENLTLKSSDVAMFWNAKDNATKMLGKVAKILEDRHVESDLRDIAERLKHLLAHFLSRKSSINLGSMDLTLVSAFWLVADVGRFFVLDANDLTGTRAPSRVDIIRDILKTLHRIRRNLNEDKNQIVPRVYDDVVPPIVPDGGDSPDDEIDHYLRATLEPSMSSGLYDPNSKTMIHPCIDGTRSGVLKEIYDWLDDLDQPNVLWLHGAPGTGKSAIAASVMAELSKRQRLASGYFFRPYALGIWPTIAYDVAQFHPALPITISDKVKALVPEGAFWHSIGEVKFRDLVRDTLTEHQHRFEHAWPVIVIDAVDAPRSVSLKEFVEELVQWNMPRQFKLFVTSRPVDEVMQVLRAPDVEVKQLELITGADVDDETTAAIQAYLIRRAALIQKKHVSLPKVWPRPEQIWKLATDAAGSFLWAKAAMDYIDRGSEPDKSLAQVAADEAANRFEELNKVYTDILIGAFGPEPALAFHTTVGAIAVAKTPLSVSDLEHLLPDRFSSAVSPESICRRLLSAISIDAEDKNLRIRHPSFIDYLEDSKRCPKDFLIDLPKSHRKLAVASLRLMMHTEHGLKFNICGLQSSYVLNSDVPNLKEIVDEAIPSHISYACQFWAEHIECSERSVDLELLNLLKVFMRTRFLYWLEALSLIGKADAASITLSSAAQWVDKSDPELSILLLEASQLVAASHEAIVASAPHIYLSMIPFAPRKSAIFALLSSQIPHTVKILKNAQDDYLPGMTYIIATGLQTQTVTYSPDGKFIAAGFSTGEIHVYQAQTGKLWKTLKGHNGTVESVKFSPNGRRIISAGSDCTIQIWDAEVGLTILDPIEGHTDWIRCLAISPNGKQIASASDDYTVCLWDISTGKSVVPPLEGHQNWVQTVKYSSNGEKIVSVGMAKICIWDTTDGNLLQNIYSAGIAYWSVIFTPDDSQIITGDTTGQISAWDTITGDHLGKFPKAHSNSIWDLVLLKNGHQVASGSIDRTIYIWDIPTKQLIHGPMLGHTAYITSLAVSPNGFELLSGAEDGTLRIWRLDMLPAETSSMSCGSLNSVVFSSDENNIIGLDDESIWMWNIITQHVEKIPLESLGYAANFQYWGRKLSPDGENVAIIGTNSRDSIKIHNFRTQEIVVLDAYTDYHLADGHLAIEYSLDGKILVSVSDDKTIRAWETQSGKYICGPIQVEGFLLINVCAVINSDSQIEVAVAKSDFSIYAFDIHSGDLAYSIPNAHTNWINTLTYSADGCYLASASVDGTVNVWKINKGNNNYMPEKLSSMTKANPNTWERLHLAFSSDNTLLACSFDILIYVWDIYTGKNICEPLSGHSSFITSIAFSHDNQSIITASDDRTVRIWKLTATSKTITIFAEHVDRVQSVTFTQDGKHLVSCSDDARIIARDMSTIGAVMNQSSFEGHTDWVRSVACSYDNLRMVSASDDMTIKVWSISEPHVILNTLHGHTQAVRSVAFAKDNRHIVSGSDDTTVCIWDLDAKKQKYLRKTLRRHIKSVFSVAFSYDYKFVASGSEDTTIGIWKVEKGGSFHHLLSGHNGSVYSIAFMNHQQHLVSGSEDCTIRIWDVETRESLSILSSVHSEPIYAIGLSSDDEWIISGSKDTTVGIWDLKKQQPAALPLRGHKNSVLSVAFSPDGASIASASADNTTCLWSSPTKIASTSWPSSFKSTIRNEEYCSVDQGGIFGGRLILVDGWIKGPNDEYLLWVPPMFRRGLRLPYTQAIFGAPDIAIDFEYAVQGGDWEKCRHQIHSKDSAEEIKDVNGTGHKNGA